MGVLNAEGGYRGDYGGCVAADGPQIENIASDSTTSAVHPWKDFFIHLRTTTFAGLRPEGI